MKAWQRYYESCHHPTAFSKVKIDISTLCLFCAWCITSHEMSHKSQCLKITKNVFFEY